MLDRIVENEQLALAPFSHLVADPKAAIGRNDERQVAHEPRVEHAGVRGNSGPRLEEREHDRGTPAWNAGERSLLDRFPGPGAARDKFIVYAPIFAQEQRTPVLVFNQSPVCIEANGRILRLDVRPKALQSLLAKQSDELGAKGILCGLHSGSPGKISRLIILDLRKLGIGKDRRLLEIELAAAGGDVESPRKAGTPAFRRKAALA